MENLAKPFNRVFFLLCVLITGSLAGAFVWLFFFLMNKGIAFLWQTVPGWISSLTAESLPVLSQGPLVLFPFLCRLCAGGLLIGLYANIRAVGKDLNVVMAEGRRAGRYDYSHIGKLSLAALLPLLFGGSVGPEAGLAGVIAGLYPPQVGREMHRFGSDFRALTIAGTQAALTAVFTAPLYGFVAPLSGTADGARGEESITLPKAQKAVVYLCAIAGALSAFLVLGQLFGESSGLPRFDAVEVGSYELALLLPFAFAGMACGWIFHAANKGTLRLSEAMGNRPVAKAVLAGIILAVCGMALPFTMFAGESQAHYLMEGYSAIPAVALIATGFVKCALTPTCLNLGWHGGHFFPVIFSGVSLGYGFALLTGAAPAFCVAACTST